MDVICPNCKGPATQPIMQIYCKRECDRPDSTMSSKKTISIPDKSIIWGVHIYQIFKKPPPERHRGSKTLHEWIRVGCVDDDDYTRAIDDIYRWEPFDKQGDTPWQGKHYESYELVIKV